MEENFRRYPIGIQNFEDLRNNDCVYVDKTELIYRLTHTNKVYFLSRPRRFGKSLLVSTLEAYFLGKKELFQGLAMETLEKDWTVYPVLHFDFSVSKYITADMLSAVINRQLLLWEKIYQREEGETTFSLRFEGIIRRAYKQTGKQVVVLIDEYDSPMLDSNHNDEVQKEIRNIMRDFFSPLKAQGQYLRFLLLTGISKFSQMSIFSELNNLQNIYQESGSTGRKPKIGILLLCECIEQTEWIINIFTVLTEMIAVILLFQMYTGFLVCFFVGLRHLFNINL